MSRGPRVGWFTKEQMTNIVDPQIVVADDIEAFQEALSNPTVVRSQVFLSVVLPLKPWAQTLTFSPLLGQGR